MPDNPAPLGDKVYVELVRSLYANPTPSLIMSAAFAVAVSLIFARQSSTAIEAIGVAGIVASVVRVSATYLLRRQALTAALDRGQARRLELTFAIPYLIFAVCLGAFGARVFWMTMPEAHMIAICLLVGYCAGVATGVGLRPWIAIPSMMIAIIPAALAAASQPDPIYLATATVSLAFLAGGIQTVLTRSTTVQAEIGKRLTWGSLARRDGLTALPNRLALREYFEDNATLISSQALIAVHYVDLDGFKPVNDRHGHATGDALLEAVAERLTNAIRNGDIVARLGGDEFAIIQFGLRRPEESELLAQRILAAVGQTFRLGDNLIRISASIGSVTTQDRSATLDQLLSEADEKLYAAKRVRAPGPRAAA